MWLWHGPVLSSPRAVRRWPRRAAAAACRASNASCAAWAGHAGLLGRHHRGFSAASDSQPSRLRRFLRVMAQYMMGSRIAYADFKRCRQLRGLRQQRRLTRKEHVFLHCKTRDLWSGLPSLVLFCIPVVGYFFPVLAYIFPQILPIHFITRLERLRLERARDESQSALLTDLEISFKVMLVKRLEDAMDGSSNSAAHSLQEALQQTRQKWDHEIDTKSLLQLQSLFAIVWPKEALPALSRQHLGRAVRVANKDLPVPFLWLLPSRLRVAYLRRHLNFLSQDDAYLTEGGHVLNSLTCKELYDACRARGIVVPAHHFAAIEQYVAKLEERMQDETIVDRAQPEVDEATTEHLRNSLRKWLEMSQTLGLCSEKPNDSQEWPRLRK
eukprot:g81644.t1